jgi:uncharacterized protein YegL
MEKEGIDITILKGDKLFNENTPFVVNIFSPDKDLSNKRSYADLICVIDASSSMRGNKIYEVKESLKILIQLMDKNDRIALILFNKFSHIYSGLEYITDENRNQLIDKIDLITTNVGTNILSGLEKAVDILKDEKKNENVNRILSVLLLSDGCDSRYNEIELSDKFKSMTKGLNLSFTLHTFGYGKYCDAKILNKLANLRDGSFYYVQEYNKITQYFVCVLGGCISVITKKAELNIKLLNNNCKIVKVFGKDNLYEYELKDESFKITLLQLMWGKEYSFVFEVKIDEKNAKVGDDLFDIMFKYEDISENNKLEEINKKYKYELTSDDYLKANEEYIRSQVYFILDQVMSLRVKNEKKEANKLLKDIKQWIIKNYKGENKETYLNDIKKAGEIFSNDESFIFVSSQIRENQFKKQGNSMTYTNNIQNQLLNSIKLPPKKVIKTNDLTKSINFQKKGMQINDLTKSVNLGFTFKKFKKK